MSQPNLHLSPKLATSGHDLNQRPLVVIWETTQACDLACVHCRACAQPFHNPNELNTAQAEKLIRDIAELKPPIFVLTGGDPLKRKDIFDLVRYSVKCGLHPALTPSATPLLTKEVLREMKIAGIARVAISLDGPNAEFHDTFRGIPGTFQTATDALRWCNELGIPVQVNTTLTKSNLHQLQEMADLLRQFKLVLWSVFCVIPTGRAGLDQLPTGEEFEMAFAKMYELSKTLPFRVKTTEGPHYRRFLIQQKAREAVKGKRNGVPPGCPVPNPEPETMGSDEPMPFMMSAAAGMAGGAQMSPADLAQKAQAQPWVNDAKGFVFISHCGDVFPSGFFPLGVGNVKRTSLTELYRESPLFKALRDPSMLRGKCGDCEFNKICGGSRARAYAVTGDPLAQDPSCSYLPQSWKKPVALPNGF